MFQSSSFMCFCKWGWDFTRETGELARPVPSGAGLGRFCRLKSWFSSWSGFILKTWFGLQFFIFFKINFWEYFILETDRFLTNVGLKERRFSGWLGPESIPTPFTVNHFSYYKFVTSIGLIPLVRHVLLKLQGETVNSHIRSNLLKKKKIDFTNYYNFQIYI